MDSITQTTVIRDAVGAGVMSPNEGRSKFDLKPVKGGESPYLQQQNYSLEALAKRDAQADPFAPNTPPAPKPQPIDQQTEKPPPPAKTFNGEDIAALLAEMKDFARDNPWTETRLQN